jgi:hypothetical protein
MPRTREGLVSAVIAAPRGAGINEIPVPEPGGGMPAQGRTRATVATLLRNFSIVARPAPARGWRGSARSAAPGIPLGPDAPPDGLLFLVGEKHPVGHLHRRAATAAADFIKQRGAHRHAGRIGQGRRIRLGTGALGRAWGARIVGRDRRRFDRHDATIALPGRSVEGASRSQPDAPPDRARLCLPARAPHQRIPKNALASSINSSGASSAM